MTVRVLSRDPTAFFFDGAVTVEGGETSVDVVTVNGSTIAGLGGSIAGLAAGVAAAQADATQALADASSAQGDATQALADAASAQGDATQALADAATAQGDVDALALVVAGKVGEAPIDGQAYARKDGGWVVAASGGGTTDDITNASGVAGATCSDALDTLDGSKIGDAPNDGAQYARRSAAWEKTYQGTVTTYSGVAASGNVILTTFVPAVNSQPVFFTVDATLVSTTDRSQHGAFRFLGSYGRGSAGATATGVLQSADTIAGSQSINLQVAGPNVQVRISMGTATCDYHARITLWPFASFNS